MSAAHSNFSTTKSRDAHWLTPWPVLLVFGVTILAYFPAIKGGQLWDDAAHITAPALQTVQGLRQIWFQLGATQQYYPVLHSAFWVEQRLWGDAVVGYHLVNVGLHATAACLFAAILIRLKCVGESALPLSVENLSRQKYNPHPAGIGPDWRGKRTAGEEASHEITPVSADPAPAEWRWRPEWLAAAIFALHPVCVESVAWISEQKNTLSLVFYLCAALAYLRFDRDRRRRWYGVASGLFVLALLSKSVTATLPAALLLMQYGRWGRLSWKRDIFPLLPWFVVGAGAGLFTAWVEHHYIGAQGEVYDLTFLQRCFLAGRVVWFYLAKLFWPADLIFIYPRWHVATTLAWSGGALALAVVMTGLWRLHRWSRTPLVAFLFFVGSLFPALGFFNVYPFVFSYVADHWQYLPCLGIIALIGESMQWAMEKGVAHFMATRRTLGVAISTGLAGVVLAVLFSLTWRQAGIYRNVETLYSATLAKNPECWLAHNNLGLCLMEAGALPQSLVHFKEAIRLKPDCADAYNNLGNAYAKIPGDAAESIAAFGQALRYYPTMPEAHSNLGWALVNTPGRLHEGIDHLQIAVQLKPEYFRAHNSLGLAWLKVPGESAKAIAEFETALKYDPHYAAARLNLGNALVTAGRWSEAIAQIGIVQQVRPDDPQVYYNLGTALARAGRPAEAAAAFEKSLKLHPGSAEAENNLGNVLVQLGREPESIAHYRASLQLDPASAETHFNLGRALRSVGDDSEAVAHYRESLRLAPGMPDIWNSFGSFLFHLERPGEAAAAYAEAVRLQPDHPLFHNNLGVALTESRKLDGAIGELRRAVELKPDYADAHYNLGVALQQAGRVREAAAEFKISGREP